VAVVSRSGRRDRPVTVLVVSVAIALLLSFLIPFAVVSFRDGVPSGLRWLVNEGGVVPGLIGCALAAPFIRRWGRRSSSRQESISHEEAAPDDGASMTP
jgi:hypothetical protein